MESKATDVNAPFVSDSAAYDPPYFEIQSYYRKYVAKVLIPEGTIDSRIKSLAKRMHEHYSKLGGKVVLLSILNGAARFCEKLYCNLSQLESQHEPTQYYQEYVRASSYSNTASTGAVKVQPISDWLLKNASDCHIVLVDDILDTGRTIKRIHDYFAEFKPKSITVTTMLYKCGVEQCGIEPEFVGFAIDNHFVIGYGLDLNQSFRDLPHVCIVDQEAIKELLVN